MENREIHAEVHMQSNTQTPDVRRIFRRQFGQFPTDPWANGLCDWLNWNGGESLPPRARENRLEPTAAPEPTASGLLPLESLPLRVNRGRDPAAYRIEKHIKILLFCLE